MASTLKLFETLWRGGDYSYYWTTPDKKSHWFPVNQPTQCPNGNRNVYFGVHPVKEIPTTNHQGEAQKPQFIRSQNNYIKCINCLFCEFDFKDWQTPERIKDHLKQFPFPSIVTFSGGGYHCYWLLQDSFFIHSDEQRTYIREVQANWVAFTDSDPQSKDIARVLRVPGTRNYKPSYAPHFPTVEIIKAKYTLRYTLDYLAEMSQPEPVEATPLPPLEVDPTCDDAERYRTQALNVAMQMIRDCPDGTKHGTLLRAARLLGGYVAGGLVTEQEATIVLETAIAAKPNVQNLNSAYRTIKAGLQYGFDYPITLEDKLREYRQWKGESEQPIKKRDESRNYWSRQFVGYWEKVR